MLQKLKLENFKGWQSLDLDLAPITLLFGTNSSGKTGILQSLLLLKQTARGFDPRQHINFGGGDRDYADFGSYHDLVFGHDGDRSVGIGLSWSVYPSELLFWFPELRDDRDSSNQVEERRISLNYDVSWRLQGDIFVDNLGYSVESVESKAVPGHFLRLERVEDDKYLVLLSDSFYEEGDNGESESSSESEGGKPMIANSPGSCYMIPYSLATRNLSAPIRIPPHFFNFEFESLMRSFFYLGSLRQYPKRYYQWTGEMKSQVIEPDGSDTIATLISSERDDKSLQKDVADWLGKLRLVQAFDVKPTDRNKRFYEVTVNIGGVESSLVDVGFGVSQVLPVITMLFSVPSGSVVLLEQPELHLHPNAQGLLADLLLHIAHKRDLQLVVESHSEHLLRRLQRRIAEQQPAFATPENIKMYFCQPGQSGSTIAEIEVDRFGQIANWPEDFLGDISGDLHEMLKAALKRRGQELEVVGHSS